MGLGHSECWVGSLSGGVLTLDRQAQSDQSVGDAGPAADELIQLAIDAAAPVLGPHVGAPDPRKAAVAPLAYSAYSPIRAELGTSRSSRPKRGGLRPAPL